MSVQAENQPRRLAPADHMRRLADDTMLLAQRMDSPARSHGEAEERIHEGERISQAIKRLVRG